MKIKTIPGNRLIEFVEKECNALLLSSCGSTLDIQVQLGFPNLQEVTKFWQAYNSGKLAEKLEELVSSVTTLDEGEELVANAKTDPLEYINAVVHLAEVEVRKSTKLKGNYPYVTRYRCGL